MKLVRFRSFWRWAKKQKGFFNNGQARWIESESIGHLPPEIWLLIYDMLNLEDSASLALSNMAMRSLLTKRNLRKLENSQDVLAKARFFFSLNIYMPNHCFCFTCVGYHRRFSGRVECKLPLWRNLTLPAHLTYIDNIGFQAVQFTTRSYRYKSLAYRVGLSDFELLCHQSRFPKRSQAWKSSDQAAITEQNPPHLLLRAQSELLYDLPSERYDPKLDEFIENLDPLGCKHVVEAFVSSYAIANIWQHRFTSKNPSKTKLRCNHCPTEYLIESDTIRVKITIWTDFGDGICPWEGEWAHLTYEPLDNLTRPFVEISRQSLSIEQRFDASFDQQERVKSFKSPTVELISLSKNELPAWFTIWLKEMKDMRSGFYKSREELRRKNQDEDTIWSLIRTDHDF